MDAAFLEVIDWERPWLAYLRPYAEALTHAPDLRAALNAQIRGLHNHRNLPLQFVPQSELPSDYGYEYFISTTGKVPTRDNLHDFFNALVWLAFPNIKRRLNALQAEEIGRTAGAVPRGRLRDAATIFDENAAIVATSHAGLVQGLREHRWHEVFETHRQVFGSTCDVWLFGHALMEKLVLPYKAITAHAWIVQVAPEFFAMSGRERRSELDRMVAGQLQSTLSTTDFTPLPVLGMPDWWEGQDEAFYRDEKVFRPKRARSR